MTSSRRLARVLITITSLTAAHGCLDSMEPTHESDVVSISVPAAVAAVESSTGYSFAPSIVVRNKGTRTLYVDQIYRRTEKLVDQKWELAAETPLGTGIRRAIGPSQTVALPYVVIYTTGSNFTFLERARGLYRVRINLSFSIAGQEPLPPQDSYSQPFSVVIQ